MKSDTTQPREQAAIDKSKPDTLAALLCCLYEGPEIQLAATMLIEQAMELEELRASPVAAPEAPTREPQADERALFEDDLRAGVHEAGGSPDPEVYVRQLLQRAPNGDYVTTWVDNRWEGWERRARRTSLPQQAVPEAPTEAQRLREELGEHIRGAQAALAKFEVPVDAQADTTTASASDDEADAYNHACELMEQFQDERAKRGVEIGTQGSLCDGIAWLFARIKELEGSAALTQQSAAQVPTLMRGAVASVASNADGEIRVNWMRPERVEAGTLLYVIVSAATEKEGQK